MERIKEKLLRYASMVRYDIPVKTRASYSVTHHGVRLTGTSISEVVAKMCSMDLLSQVEEIEEGYKQ